MSKESIPILTPPEQWREDGLCVNCVARLATETWCPGGAIAYIHGGGYAWCKPCVLREQIKHCREAARRLPRLQAELRRLIRKRA